jgi:hypothetical protein
MYIDRLETENGTWCQACIGFNYTGPGKIIEACVNTLLTTSGIVPDLQIALRVWIGKDGVLNRCLILTAPHGQVAELRNFAALFSRIEFEGPGTIRLPSDVDVFEELLGQFPECQVRTVPEGLRRGAVWFAAPFRTGPRLEQLLLEGRSMGFSLCYQLNAIGSLKGRDHVRLAAHNLLAMQRLPGLPPALLQLQQRVMQKLSSNSYMVEEHIGCMSAPAMAAVVRSLDRYFQSAMPELHTGIRFEPGMCADLLAAGIHSCTRRIPRPDEICSMSANGTEVSTLLGWTPGPVLARELNWQSAPSGPPSIAPDIATISAYGLKPYSGDKPYVFISYSHSDFAAVAPLMYQLQKSGLRFWMDHGIAGSSEWTQVIEERLGKCSLLLIFLSQKAVDSKYVRREILMADTLNKPLLTLCLGAPELRWGLKLLLPQYQMVAAGVHPISQLVRQALSAHYPSQSLD